MTRHTSNFGGGGGGGNMQIRQYGLYRSYAALVLLLREIILAPRAPARECVLVLVVVQRVLIRARVRLAGKVLCARCLERSCAPRALGIFHGRFAKDIGVGG